MVDRSAAAPGPARATQFSLYNTRPGQARFNNPAAVQPTIRAQEGCESLLGCNGFRGSTSGFTGPIHRSRSDTLYEAHA